MRTLHPQHERILRRAIGADQTRQPVGYRNHYLVELRDAAEVATLDHLVELGLMAQGRTGASVRYYVATLEGIDALGCDLATKQRAAKTRKNFELPPPPEDEKNARARRRREELRALETKAS